MYLTAKSLPLRYPPSQSYHGPIRERQTASLLRRCGSGDRESTVLASIKGSPIGSHNIPLGAAGIAKVQEWIDNPASNRGLVLLDYGNTDGLDLRASEFGTVGERPRLTMTVPEAGFISGMMAGLSLLAAFARRKASISSRGLVRVPAG